MAKKKSNLVKIVRKWENKSGTKEVVYYYEKTNSTRSTKSGKKTKQTFKRVKEVKSRKASINSVEKAKEYLQSKSINVGSEKAQIILNEIRDGKTFTTQQIDRRIEKYPSDRDEKDISNLLRALGYSKDEFLKELNINESELEKGKGKFEKIGNDIRFTTTIGNIIYFEWDYDAGFIQR